MMKKLQHLFAPFCLLLVFVLGMRHFGYWGGSGATSTDEMVAVDFIAPLTRHVIKPLNTEIDFIDTKRTAEEQLSDIDTEWGFLTFSTYGASLERFIAKRQVNGAIQEIPLLFPVAQTDRERQCFLVGLAEKTPYYYTLEKQQSTEHSYELSYKAETEDVEIRKTFIIHKHIHTITLKLEITPKKMDVDGVEPRIVYPSPFMPNLGDKDTIAGIIIDRDGVFKKTVTDSLDLQRGWFAPRIFGSEDKYFVNALVTDEQHFVQRAYYNLIGTKSLFSFLEGPLVKESRSWSLSFYLGPKEVKAFMAVDERLDKTLGYSGLLAPISRVLLQALQWLYGYLGNYGWAIVVLIALMQILMLPFTLRGERSAKETKEYRKKMAYVEQRYKNDREALMRERALVMQKHGPGLSGLLLILLFRMPTFFALQQVLSNAIELYHAPFLWISDLSVPDPYYIFPLLVAGGMFVQAFTVDAGQRVQLMVMALIVGGVTATLSAGLALYITASTLLSILQTAVIRSFKLA